MIAPQSAAPRPIAGPVACILGAALLVAAAIGFLLVPAGTQLPIHWGLAGEPDNFAPREVALLIPLGMAAFVWGLTFGIRRVVSAAVFENGRHTMRAVLVALTGLALAIEVVIVLIGIGWPADMVRVIALGIAVLLLLLGNAMPKSQPNGFAGLRIPSTLNDPRNWQLTHRLVGWLWMGAGALLGVLALLGLPAPMLFGLLMAAVLLPLLVGTLYSWRLARPR